jgi:hypothetical protein
VIRADRFDCRLRRPNVRRRFDGAVDVRVDVGHYADEFDLMCGGGTVVAKL